MRNLCLQTGRVPPTPGKNSAIKVLISPNLSQQRRSLVGRESGRREEGRNFLHISAMQNSRVFPPKEAARARNNGSSHKLHRGIQSLPFLCSFCQPHGSAKRRAPGLVNFVPAVAYHFCLSLHAAFSQPGDHLYIFSVKCTCVLNMRFCTSEAEVSGRQTFSRSR